MGLTTNQKGLFGLVAVLCGPALLKKVYEKPRYISNARLLFGALRVAGSGVTAHTGVAPSLPSAARWICRR